MATLKDWFCLAGNRDNFKLKVREDSNLIFCHIDEIDNQIIGSIERRFAANEPIKMLIYGDWGVGKTHTAYHIAWWLKEHMAECPAYPLMIEVGDLERKSRFDVLVRPFLDAIGVHKLVDWTGQYLKLKGNLVKALKDVGVSDYVAATISKFTIAVPGETPPPVVMDAFQILQGRKPGPGFASNSLGFQLTESRELFGVLLAIGEMYRAIHGHRIVFVADEAARLDEVSNDEATLAHWVAVNRDIFDDNNNTFGFMYTLTGKANRLPRAIWEPQIQNRIGQNAFELRTLSKPDVEEFLARLVRELVDRTKVDQLVADGTIPQSAYDASAYPFTKPAKQRFVEFFQRTQENAKPRDISDRLDLLGFIAIKSGARLIDEPCLEKANM
jgi:hypothetical protein